MANRWYKLTKEFQGGQDVYQIPVPKDVRLSQTDWDAIMEWIGDNTPGGHSYGYRIYRRALREKSPKLEVLSYPADLCSSLMSYGRKVTYSRRMI
jgi:hypothetical protein